ncbi:MAG: branched-chain amino acid ABC transporter permease [Caldibacillus debilis]|uniref:Branched-chain amino acid ABC transporter permease n=1 Tax=Caldibacillus debilis TaxID=301148 RepID=A0A3E0JYA1_9BACI|nr:ABC transporter permease [Caldibacillus debilis]REJ24865.1 MAG: branched-chain amino acid ABC transporter permease [Caldibacillus debilis]
MAKRVTKVVIPVLAVILGLLVGALIMLISGYDPVMGYQALWQGIFGDPYVIGESIRQITPYLLAGLAVAFAFRTGLFNIGVEGQLIVGWFAAVYVGIAFQLPAYIHLPLALLAAGLAGALWAFVPGILKAKLGVNEVVVTIMMNYVALHVTNALIRQVAGKDMTERIHETASLRVPYFEQITDYSRLHGGIFIALLAVFIVWFILERTTLGFELKSVGFNRDASQYAGMNVPKNIVTAMVISGFLAGLAGAMEGLGTFEYVGTKSAMTGIGFDGIAVSILGANHPIGVIFGATLFGALKYGSLNMPNPPAEIPEEMISIIIAIIIFFVASGYLFLWLYEKFLKKKGVK